MEITIHTGTQDDHNKINIDWFDHNNAKQKTVIEINVQSQDKPRTLELLINGVLFCLIPPQ